MALQPAPLRRLRGSVRGALDGVAWWWWWGGSAALRVVAVPRNGGATHRHSDHAHGLAMCAGSCTCSSGGIGNAPGVWRRLLAFVREVRANVAAPAGVASLRSRAPGAAWRRGRRGGPGSPVHGCPLWTRSSKHSEAPTYPTRAIEIQGPGTLQSPITIHSFTTYARRRRTAVVELSHSFSRFMCIVDYKL